MGSSRTSRWIRIVGMFAALALVVAACSSGSSKPKAGGTSETTLGTKGADDANLKPTPGGAITYALEAETTGGWCLPEANLAISGIQVARAIYDTLTAPDSDGKIKPFLAESVTSANNNTEWTIKLRDGVTFSDGSKLDATVVKNNLDAYRGKYTGRSPLLFLFVFQDIKDTSVVDPLTVKVTTARPWVAFPWFLWGSGRIGIMGQKQLDSKSCDKTLIGTGPFTEKSWVVNDSFVAVKNPHYWQKDADGVQYPYLDQITFKPLLDGTARYNGLLSGDFDMIHTSSDQTIEKARVEAKNGKLRNVESDKYGEVSYTMLNSSKPPFDSLTARQAVAYGTDRDLINKIQNRGIPTVAQGPFAPGSVGYLPDTGWPKYDLNHAKELVAQYKQETGKDLKFTLTYQGDPETTALAQMLQQQAQKAGIQVDIAAVSDQSQLISVAEGGTFQALTWRNHPGADPDTQYVWWYNKGKANPVNFSRFDDPEIDRLFDDMRSNPDEAARKADAENINRQFAKQLYLQWGWYTIWSIESKPTVHGVLSWKLPDGSSTFDGLPTGHPVQALWVQH